MTGVETIRSVDRMDFEERDQMQSSISIRSCNLSSVSRSTSTCLLLQDPEAEVRYSNGQDTGLARDSGSS
jgi:hypothetical protein